MKLEIKEVIDENSKTKISEKILCNLPKWFGRKDSIREYVKESTKLPFIACFYENEPVGFIVLKETGKDTCEIFVMGVLEEHHRKGIGSILSNAYEELAKKKGYTYSQVKTVKKGKYHEYDITNSFYKAMGYSEFECLKTLWDKDNPCQIYVKYLNK